MGNGDSNTRQYTWDIHRFPHNIASQKGPYLTSPPNQCMLQSGESSKFLGLLSFLAPTQCRKGNQGLCSLTLFWTTPNLKDTAITEEAEMAPVNLSPLNDTNNMRKIYLLLLSLYVLWMPINTCDCTQPIIAKSKLTTYLPLNSQPMAGCTVMAANTPAYPQN